MKYLYTYNPRHIPEFYIETSIPEKPAWIKNLEDEVLDIWPDREPCTGNCISESCEVCIHESSLCG